MSKTVTHIKWPAEEGEVSEWREVIDQAGRELTNTLYHRIFVPGLMNLDELASVGKIISSPNFLLRAPDNGINEVYFSANANYSCYWFFAPRAGTVLVDASNADYSQLVIAKGVAPFEPPAATLRVPCESYVRYDRDSMPTDYVEVAAGDFVGVGANRGAIDNTSAFKVYTDLFDEVEALNPLFGLDGKQDKLIAGSGITIAEDGKTISSTGGGSGGGVDSAVVDNLNSRIDMLHRSIFADVSGMSEMNVEDVGNLINKHLLASSANAQAVSLTSNQSYKAYWFFAPRDGKISFNYGNCAYFQLVVAKGVSDGFNVPTGSFTIPCETHTRTTKADGNVPALLEVTSGDFIVVGCNNAGNPSMKTDVFSELKSLNDDFAKQIGNVARNAMTDYYSTDNPESLWADTDTLRDSSKVHEAFAALCASSDGYVEQHAMGTDDHGNTMYYYETNVPDTKYGTNRESGQPVFPINGGKPVPYKTVILSGGIHGTEINPSYMLYNLLKGLIDKHSGIMNKIRNRVKFVLIPVACPSGFNADTYENVDGVNVNRAFPLTSNGACACKEAENIKSVIDTFGDSIDLHMDVHTFHAGNFTAFTFTDSEDMAVKGCEVGVDVAGRYKALYPKDTNFTKAITSSPNLEHPTQTGTTCTKYTQEVYGAVAGTIEAVGNYLTGTGWTATGTRYIALLLDYVATMVDKLVLVETGDVGLSAYQIAVKNGFDGTETEWLESLRGPDYLLKRKDIEDIAEYVMANLPNGNVVKY